MFSDALICLPIEKKTQEAHRPFVYPLNRGLGGNISRSIFKNSSIGPSIRATGSRPLLTSSVLFLFELFFLLDSVSSSCCLWICYHIAWSSPGHKDKVAPYVSSNLKREPLIYALQEQPLNSEAYANLIRIFGRSGFLNVFLRTISFVNLDVNRFETLDFLMTQVHGYVGSHYLMQP